MLRIATPLVDGNRKRRGIIIINIEMRYLLNLVRAPGQSEQEVEYLLVNKQGDLLNGEIENLQAQLNETEQKLGELQSARKDSSSLLMSPEQQAEVQKFLDEQVRIRQELRTVRRNLDRDIDNLGTTLKILNIVLVPLLLTVVALTAVYLKRRRKSAS
jgi:ABC-type uncharacterized transport system involved in gliding motility auxiliary subunit